MKSSDAVDPRGALQFARYAYPPNELGYCGPAKHQELLDYGSAGVADPGLEQLARGFEGAWPYLEFIATATGVGNPLDARVVEAYWLGGPLLDKIDMATLGNSLMDRFRAQTGSNWGYLAEAIPAGSVPDHNFHVFGVYPWVGLLRKGKGESQAVEVLEKCRIRWGQVVTLTADQVVVESQPLEYHEGKLSLGVARVETVQRALGGKTFVGELTEGDWVALHWGWLCDRLDRRQLSTLRTFTARQLDITNNKLAHPGPAMVIG